MTQEKKQTAVQWLIEQINSEQYQIAFPNTYISVVVCEQALAMEKEQMHKCASFWRGKETEIEKSIFNQYYNDTYGKE